MCRRRCPETTFCLVSRNDRHVFRPMQPPFVRGNLLFVASRLFERRRAATLLRSMSRVAHAGWANRRRRASCGFDPRGTEHREHRMKQHAILVVTSLLSILLLTLHVTDDIVRGISKAEPSNTALLVLAVFLYGTLVLAERQTGYVLTLLVGLFAAGMPVIHMRGAHYPEIARSAGGFFFVWTLWALGAVGGATFILSARGLWRLRRGREPR